MSADNKFQFLIEKIRRNKGVDFSLYREGTLRRRIDSRLRTTGCADYLEYVSFLNRNPEEYDRLLEAVTINVTEFFRNPETFLAIQKKVLPEIIKNKLGLRRLTTDYPGFASRRRAVAALCRAAKAEGSAEASMDNTDADSRLSTVDRQRSDHIRVWCAGTSYGEEAYGVAILFLQLLRGKNASFDVKILGTDIDPDCIAKAQTGLYEPSHLKEVGRNILNRYFSREGNKYRINDEVRQLTEFKPHNLIADKDSVNNYVYFAIKVDQGILQEAISISFF